jgi:hypothetical protein
MSKTLNIKILNLLFGMLVVKIKSDYYGDITIKIHKVENSL